MPKKYLVGMILLALVEIGLALYLTEWRHTFWNYVQEKNYSGFKHELCIFVGVALVFCFVSAYATYLGTLGAIKWRKKLTHKSMSMIQTNDIENLNQRIQEDCREYPALFVTLGFGTLKAFTYVVVFSIALIWQFNWWYWGLVMLYAVVSTLLIRKIAKPLIALNYNSQRAEATFRNSIKEINFSSCITIMLGLATKTKHLQYASTFYGQMGVIIALLIIAPAYFAGKFSFGALMQLNSTMLTLIDNCSYGINSFDLINKFLSCRKRLKEINII